jgi:hypothetical protein
MKSIPRILAIVLVGSALFTWWALESSGVAEIETRSAEGTSRSTHVWYAESGKQIWLEAGTPENGWYVDIQANPKISFKAGERSGTYRALPMLDPAARHQMRSLLRKKYGIRDRWIALLFDTSNSIAVQLLPQRD